MIVLLLVNYSGRQVQRLTMLRDKMHALVLILRDRTHRCQRRDDDSFWSNVFSWKFAEYAFSTRHLDNGLLLEI